MLITREYCTISYQGEHLWGLALEQLAPVLWAPGIFSCPSYI